MVLKCTHFFCQSQIPSAKSRLQTPSPDAIRRDTAAPVPCALRHARHGAQTRCMHFLLPPGEGARRADEGTVTRDFRQMRLSPFGNFKHSFKPQRSRAQRSKASTPFRRGWLFRPRMTAVLGLLEGDWVSQDQKTELSKATARPMQSKQTKKAIRKRQRFSRASLVRYHRASPENVSVLRCIAQIPRKFGTSEPQVGTVVPIPSRTGGAQRSKIFT